MQKPFILNKLCNGVVKGAIFLLVVSGYSNVRLATTQAADFHDPVKWEAFMDGVIQAQLEAYNIAGAVVAVVKDGSLFIAKGYGFADLEKRKRVEADKTLFRIASISKLFVWTAVMQLVEQGKLDLNKNINTYLTHFKIPNTYDNPVTLAHLMAHTAGFEEYVIGLFGKKPDRLKPLGDILAKQLPARVRQPGEIVSYSNHGTGIAAYIVEQVSGMAWDDYVEENIIKPLCMANTSFRQPIPGKLSANLSKGYSYIKGELKEEPFIYVPLAPVGSASTTATDIANFMIAHLNLGQFNGARILDSSTALKMQSALFRHTPEVNPMAHGFFDMSRNNQRVIGHGGNLFYFHSMMALLPEQKVGLFISYNTDGGRKAVMKTYELFMDRLFPPKNVQLLTPSEKSVKRLNRFAGRYFSTRRVHMRLAKLGALLGTVKVTVADDGVLKTSGTETSRWIETKPLTFRKENGFDTLAFRQNEIGQITHMFIGSAPYVALERISFKDSLFLHVALGLAAMLTFFTTTISWPFAAFISWQHKVKFNPWTSIPRWAYLFAWSSSFLFIVISGFLAISLADPSAIAFGIPIWINVISVLSIVTVILTMVALIYTLVIWKSGKGSIWGRIYYTIVMLALLSATWQLSHWNLLGFQY